MRMRPATRAALVLSAALLGLTACNNGSDTGSDDSPRNGASSRQNTPAASATAKTPGPLAWLLAEDACTQLAKIDPKKYLGPQAAVQDPSHPCDTDKTLENNLGIMVWADAPNSMTDAADHERITVGVTGGKDYFATLRDQKDSKGRLLLSKEQRNCTIVVAGSRRACLNIMATEGGIAIDMGDSTLKVFASVSSTSNGSAKQLTSAADQAKLRRFATDAGNILYQEN